VTSLASRMACLHILVTLHVGFSTFSFLFSGLGENEFYGHQEFLTYLQWTPSCVDASRMSREWKSEWCCKCAMKNYGHNCCSFTSYIYMCLKWTGNITVNGSYTLICTELYTNLDIFPAVQWKEKTFMLVVYININK